MHRLLSALLLSVVPDQTQTVELNGHHFTLPAGFTIELVAAPPVLMRPISADFDERGRLFVTDSNGSNENVNVQLAKKPHRVLCLESTKGDGKFDKSTVFADKMMFPEGMLCYKGSVYVAAPPSIWKLTDTKGTGVADSRVEWFQGKTLTGCGNDLHGPYLGPDGWIYWCKGAFAKQTYDLPGKKGWNTRAAHIFRARPDGTGVEPVMTGGMDNPVDIVFTPGGERIFDTTFLQNPAGGKRDGIMHAVYGGIYGKPHHDVLDSHPWTGPDVMPVMTHLGVAAPAGLHRYESDAFGKEYQDNIFCCSFNMRKVFRCVLVPDGATFKTIDSDFLVSDNADFHPTDVIEDADGSLIVVDTGGWHKLCCPTSQLVKSDLLGAIYRIRKNGMPKVDDPRGLKLDWSNMLVEKLMQLLQDNRAAVRRRAIQALAEHGSGAFAAILTPSVQGSALSACNYLWAATRVDDPKARELARNCLSNQDETIRQVAIHSISIWRDRAAVPKLLEVLKGESAQNRRAAAEALGRIGDKSAIPALVTALREPCDRVLEHSLIYALIELDDAKAIEACVKGPNEPAFRATLIALDQMPGSNLKSSAVTPVLASKDPKLKEAAWWIAGRHPEWGGEVAGFLRDRLAAKDLPLAEQDELVRQLAKFGKGGPVQKLLAAQLGDSAASPAAKRTVLRAMGQTGLKQAPEDWLAALVGVFRGDQAELTKEAINTARLWRDPKQRSNQFAVALQKVGDDAKLPVEVRLAALAAVPGGMSKVEPKQFELLLAHLGADQPVPLRSAASDALARAKLNKDQLRSLTSTLKNLGPMELDRVLEAYTGNSDETVGKELLAALSTAVSKNSLRIETMKPRLVKFGPAVQKQAAALYASLNLDAAKEEVQLEKMLATLKYGDIARGRTVFNSEKAACFVCHAIGYRGGTVGPDLTRIAKIRTDRELLEAVIFPSTTFVRGYEPVVVTTRDGKVHNGVIRGDGADEIGLATGVNQFVRLAREEIDDIRPSQVSVMPAGYETLLTHQELADLLAFMKACK